MGSVDIPPFLREKMKQKVQAEKADIPPFLQKKSGGEDVTNGLVQPTSPSPLPAADNGLITPASKAFEIPSATVVTNDGVTLGIPAAFGVDANAIQSRVSQGIALPQDVDILAKGNAKSPAVISAFIKNKDLGLATDMDESIARTKDALTIGINTLNKNFGTTFNPDEVLSSPDKSSQFLQQVKAFRKNPIDQEKQAMNEFTNLSHEDFNIIQKDLSDNIKKLTAEEAIAKGLSLEQAGDLVYKRLDPVGYQKSQEIRKPKNQVLRALAVTTPVGAISDFYSWATNSEQKNREALNAEKGQSELDANKGLQDVALEKKAKGILTNDENLINEANLILGKVKNQDDIIEQYPLLMKQKMAEYVNQRFAQDAGTIEGTEPTGEASKLTQLFGVNDTQARKYLKEGGFLDNPKYKDLAEEIAAHPKTYFADNSPFGGVVSSVLKPFVSVFHTVNDLTGIRSEADRRRENVEAKLFPEQLPNAKEDISFDVGGQHFGMNIHNTMNGVANLAGYMALATATAGAGGALGASATTAGRLGAWGSFGMEAVDTGLKEADEMGLNPAQAWLYSSLKGAMMAEGGRLLEFGKSAVPTIKGVNEKLAQAVKGISDKSITEDAAKELLDGASNAWLKGLTKYGIGTAKGAGVMAGFGVGDTLLRVAFNDENADVSNILPEAANAYFNGLFTMGILGSMGIKGNVEHNIQQLCLWLLRNSPRICFF